MLNIEPRYYILSASHCQDSREFIFSSIGMNKVQNNMNELPWPQDSASVRLRP